MLPKKAVQQRHSTGCGPAVLATVLGISYFDAVKLVFPKKIPLTYSIKKGKLIKFYGSYIEQLKKVLDKQKVPCTFKTPRKWKDFNKDAIVQIQYITGTTHFLLWSSVNKKFLDPLENFNISKFGKQDSKRVIINAFNRGPRFVLFL